MGPQPARRAKAASLGKRPRCDQNSRSCPAASGPTPGWASSCGASLRVSVSISRASFALLGDQLLRECPTFCVSGQSVSEVDLERKQCGAPVVGVSPALLGVDDREVDQFAGSLLGGEVSSGLDENGSVEPDVAAAAERRVVAWTAR